MKPKGLSIPSDNVVSDSRAQPGQIAAGQPSDVKTSAPSIGESTGQIGRRQPHTPDERRQGLVVFASVNGRKDLVVPMLEGLELDINFRTLQDWAYRRHGDEYEQIKQEYDAYIRSQAADSYRSVASLATEVSQEALRQIAEALKRGEVSLKELPKVAAQAMVTAGIGTDKGELLSGNPTQRLSVTADDAARELASVGVTILVPGADGKLAPIIDVKEKSRPQLPAAADAD